MAKLDVILVFDLCSERLTVKGSGPIRAKCYLTTLT
jgi:hypothetical protein